MYAYRTVITQFTQNPEALPVQLTYWQMAQSPLFNIPYLCQEFDVSCKLCSSTLHFMFHVSLSLSLFLSLSRSIHQSIFPSICAPILFYCPSFSPFLLNNTAGHFH